MAEQFGSTTIILNCEVDQILISEEDDVWSTLEKCAIPNFILNGSSRRGWQGLAIHELCQISKTRDLSFLYGSLCVHGNWRFVDEKYDLGICVYAFDSDGIRNAVTSLDRLIQWIRSNVDLVSNIKLINSDVGPSGVAQAVTSAQISSYPAQNSPQGDDGDDPWYLFSFLLSIYKVMSEALELGKSVLHVSTVGWDLRDSWAD